MKMNKFFVGQMFSSFEEFDKHLKEFENAFFVKFSKRDSRRLESVKEGRITYHMKKELIYYEIKYACVKGGRQISKSTGKRNSRSSKCACPAYIYLRVSRDGKSLEVRSFNDAHNHENFLDAPPTKKRNRNKKSNLDQRIINGVLVEPNEEYDEPERTAASQYLFFVTQQQNTDTEVNSEEIKKTSETPAIHRISKDETEVEDSPDEPSAMDSFSELVKQQNKILLSMANTMQEKTEESKKQTLLLQQILDKFTEFSQ